MTRSAFALAAVILLTSAPAQTAERGSRPLDVGTSEKTSSRLAQLDVTVSGPPELVNNLTAGDFEVRVGGRFIEGFIVDRVCRAPVPVTAEEAAAVPGTVQIQADSPVTYVFYFDMAHLTMTGYHRAFELAEKFIDEFFDGTARGTVISSAREMKVAVGTTFDRQELLDGLARLKEDRTQFDPFAMEEDRRVEQVMEKLEDDRDLALGLALQMQKLEQWRARQSMHRLSMVLGSLAEYDAPKAFLYFADTMRSNAGKHYIDIFGAALVRTSFEETETLEMDAMVLQNSFDRIINEASALGIRFYSVEARGLVTDTSPRVGDAQNTMHAMALETGGRAFTGGTTEKKMVRQIREDLSCLYLVSFDPEGLPLDSPLSVRLNSTRSKVSVRTRGRLVIQSDSARRTSRLLAAFATSDEEASGHPLETRVIPTGYKDGKFTALVQVTIPPTEVTNATWDVGVSLLSKGTVSEDASGRVQTANTGIRVIFEKSMSFPPGEYELAAVAHELTTDQVLSRRFEGEWEDPNASPATVSDIVVIQPALGAFLRNERLRKKGGLVVEEQEAVHIDRPSVIIGLVCRAKSNKNDLKVERALRGEDSAPFGDLLLTHVDGERCALVQDRIKAGQLTEGGFVYELSVMEKGIAVASGSCSFRAVGPGG